MSKYSEIYIWHLHHASAMPDFAVRMMQPVSKPDEV